MNTDIYSLSQGRREVGRVLVSGLWGLRSNHRKRRKRRWREEKTPWVELLVVTDSEPPNTEPQEMSLGSEKNQNSPERDKGPSVEG